MSVNLLRVIRISAFALIPALAVVLSIMFLHEVRTAHAGFAAMAKETAGEAERSARADIIARCKFLPPEDQTSCKERLVRRAREREREAYELAAQQQAALWNAAMGEAALIGVPLAVFTLILVFFTFREQREANAHAKRQFRQATADAKHAAEATERSLRIAQDTAAAASRQVEIAQDTAYRELRAYISLESVRIIETQAEWIHAGLAIRNAGKTPATYNLYLALWVGPHPIVDQLPPEVPAPLRFAFHSPYINAESTETVDCFYPLYGQATSDQAKEAISGLLTKPTEQMLYIYGRIEFMDFQRHRRVLNFAYRNHGGLKIGHSCEAVALMFGNKYEDQGPEPVATA